ncbi:hypothetical protein [Polaribacter septentrionalilitoris]|uniref:hypothetical protein n=1 Tax=Polaribacter septentrionalilitoris TaxID=2494657 RepID=UPI001359EA30|nr:hypothetical protein [Polaribacter septentrionalilitoris]
MVKIVDFTTYQKEDGTEFCTLKVQAGVEAIKSKQTGRMYLTAKTARVPCTFSEEVCESLIGSELPGIIKKVTVEPYDYAVPDTGEIITLSERNEYISEEEAIIQESLVKKEEVF